MGEAVFAKILQMSLIGCYSTLLVLLARLLLIRLGCERKYAYWLWMAVFLNLSVPVSVSGMFSFLPRQLTEISMTEQSEIFTEDTVWNMNVLFPEEAGKEERLPEKGKVPAEHTVEKKTKGTGTFSQIRSFAAEFWILGVLVLSGFYFLSVVRLNRELSGRNYTKWDEEERIAEVEGLAAPFVWGLFRPVIYLPSCIEEKERPYIVAHEDYHRKRKDHLVKLLIFAVTILHWFNPFAWIACGLCSRDMEISCDENVLAGAKVAARKSYAESLLKYAAGQNRYLIRPLTFGEPFLKSRIRNVLRQRKNSMILSLLALFSVLAVTGGLLLRPAEREKEEAPKRPEGEILTEAPDTEETEENIQVVNNGGTVIRVNGALYYIAGNELYSNGRELYTSMTNEDGSWAVYTYELDGSGFRKCADGRIVGWSEEWNIPYVLTSASDQEVGNPEEPGLYLMGELDMSLVCSREHFLGVDGEYAFFERKEKEGGYVDQVWAGDGTVTENILGTPIGTLGAEEKSSLTITEFYAERDYILLAAGEDQGSGFSGNIYSYNRTPGRLLQSQLEEPEGDFSAAGGYIYFKKKGKEGEQPGLYRMSYDLTGERKVGEGLTFLKYDEASETVLAAKESDISGVSDLVRMNPDGSGELLLLHMKDAVDWEFLPGDTVEFSEVELLGDVISVRAEQRGDRGDSSEDRRDSSIRSAYFQIKADGSGYEEWDPELIKQEEEELADLSSDMPGVPCVPEEEGWNLSEATDIRRNFESMSDIPEPDTEMDVYLLGEEKQYTLYGRGDYEHMLLAFGDSYAEIRCPYVSDYRMLPELMASDYDGDGEEELAIKLNIKHGTGYYVDTFLMGDLSPDGKLYVYQFMENDIIEQLSEPLSWKKTEEGLQAYVSGKPAGKAMQDEDGGYPYHRVDVGTQIRFSYEEEQIFAEADLEFWNEEEQPLPEYNGWKVEAKLDYMGNGKFVLNNFRGLGEGM